MKLHRVPYDPNERRWCGPTAIASIMGITYNEADHLLRRVRGQNSRVVHTNHLDHVKVLYNYMRRRDMRPLCYYISIDVDEQRRPKLRELDEINRIIKVYADRDWIPVAIYTGQTGKRCEHILAYDHRRKLLCDTNTRGKLWPVREHMLKHHYVHGILVVGKEFYSGRN